MLQLPNPIARTSVRRGLRTHACNHRSQPRREVQHAPVSSIMFPRCTAAGTILAVLTGHTTVAAASPWQGLGFFQVCFGIFRSETPGPQKNKLHCFCYLNPLDTNAHTCTRTCTHMQARTHTNAACTGGRRFTTHTHPGCASRMLSFICTEAARGQRAYVGLRGQPLMCGLPKLHAAALLCPVRSRHPSGAAGRPARPANGDLCSLLVPCRARRARHRSCAQQRSAAALLPSPGLPIAAHPTA